MDMNGLVLKKLKAGDLVMDSNGNYYPIRRITSMTVVENVYNIEVEDNHNYYVSRDNILVHNRKTKQFVGDDI